MSGEAWCPDEMRIDVGGGLHSICGMLKERMGNSSDSAGGVAFSSALRR